MMAAGSIEESAALDRLRSRLLSSGDFSKAAGRQMLAAFGGVELCLLRFLRARDLDASRARAALLATLAFREQNSVGTPETLATAHADGVGDWWCGTFAGRTESGCPVTYWRFRCIEADQLKQRFDESQLKRFYIAWMERGLALQREITSQLPAGSPGNVDIYDLEGVGWRQLSSGARLLSGVLSVAQEHYPENLKQAVVVNAPATFTGAWRVISAVVDKSTQEKFIIRKDGAEQALDALLGGGPRRRAAVWSQGDLQLGGRDDNLVSLSESGGWRHEETVTVGRAEVVPHAEALESLDRQRLVWRFDIEEAESLSFSVHFVPAGTERSTRGIDRSSAEIRPAETYSGPGRGSIAQLSTGQYRLIWQAQPPRRRSRTLQLRLRCWLQDDKDHPLGALEQGSASVSSVATTADGGGSAGWNSSVPYTLPVDRSGYKTDFKRRWLPRLLLGVLVASLLGAFYYDAMGPKRSRLVWAWLRLRLVELKQVAVRPATRLRRALPPRRSRTSSVIFE